MKNLTYISKAGFSKYLIILTIPLLFNACDLFEPLEDQPEKIDLIESYEKLLTSKKWTLMKSTFHHAGNDVVTEPIDTMIFVHNSCEQDDHFVFMKNYEYQMNKGSKKCDPDEDMISDRGDWYFDDSYDNSDYVMLFTSSWDPDRLLPDFEYEVLKLTSMKMVIRWGGCSDTTKPDTDGICVTYTMRPL